MCFSFESDLKNVSKLAYIKIDNLRTINFVRKFICPKSGVVQKLFRPKVLNSLTIESTKERNIKVN